MTYRTLRFLWALLCVALPLPAVAGAWTQNPGQGQAIFTFAEGLGMAWSLPGTLSRFERKMSAQTYIEYGVIENVTLLVTLSGENYTFSAPRPDVYRGLDYSGLGLRMKLAESGAWVLSLEVSGAFSGAQDRSRPAQNGNSGGEADARVCLGRNLSLFGDSAFVNAEVGYRLRTEDPPDEIHADLTLGVEVLPKTQILMQSFNEVSTGAGAAGFRAFEQHQGQLSVVRELDARWSIQVGGFGTLFRRNQNSAYGGLVAIWRRF